jgi:TonB family protein
MKNKITIALIVMLAGVAQLALSQKVIPGTVHLDNPPPPPPPPSADFIVSLNTDRDKDKGDSTSPFTIVQQMPKFKGDLNKYLSDSLRYPEVEREANISGRVYITFIVEKNGDVSNVKVLRGVPGGPGLDKEAVRVVSRMPAWNPGLQDGKPVRVQFNLPIQFELK